ncbi:hypothetical protein ACKXF6_06980 [Faecalibacterium taiwanense]|uniref:hypothetical protein n=1 Tax=Faecalibacterium taiwanense TaxID=3030638 RepID=UPI003AB08A39
MDFAFVAAPTLVRAKPFHLLSQIARLLERPTGAFIAAQPQGRSKRIFTKKAIREDESFRYDPSCEKEHSKNPQFLNAQNIKIKFPLTMAKRMRSCFKS